MAYPVLLETLLGAEEATLDTNAQALGALEGTGIVFAVGAKALLLRGGLFGHGGSIWCNCLLLSKRKRGR